MLHRMGGGVGWSLGEPSCLGHQRAVTTRLEGPWRGLGSTAGSSLPLVDGHGPHGGGWGTGYPRRGAAGGKGGARPGAGPGPERGVLLVAASQMCPPETEVGVEVTP